MIHLKAYENGLLEQNFSIKSGRYTFEFAKLPNVTSVFRILTAALRAKPDKVKESVDLEFDEIKNLNALK